MSNINYIQNVENDVLLPENIEVDLCPDETYGVPYISVFNREEYNDDTIIFSLEDGSVIEAEFDDDEQFDEIQSWVYANLDYLYNAWYKNEMKIIVRKGEPEVL